jgi:RHS repeat-associated protein
MQALGHLDLQVGDTDPGSHSAAAKGRPAPGQSYYRARYYDAAAGRFPSEDPLGFGSRGVNLYAYVENRPLGFRDPYGLFPVPPCVRKLLSPYFPSLDFDSVNLHNMLPLPGDVVGFTWDNDVFITPSQYDIHSALGIALIGHELTHAQDFQLLGKNAFAALYGLNFAINYHFNGNDFDKAYWDVSFERDARAMETKINNDLYKKLGLGGDPCPQKGKCSDR